MSDFYAFPSPIANTANHDITFSTHYGEGGITARDYFAAKVLQAVINLSALCDPPFIKHVTDHCYNIADSMMESRNRVKVPTV